MATEPKVGETIPADQSLPGRDAIRVPVVPVRSAEWLARSGSSRSTRTR